MAAALPPGPAQEAIVRCLLAAGADPTLRNLENEQPVHLLRPGPGPEGVSTEPAPLALNSRIPQDNFTAGSYDSPNSRVFKSRVYK